MLDSKKSSKKIRLFKDKSVRITKNLAKTALDSKWVEDQSKNTNKIVSPCEFCNYVKLKNFETSFNFLKKAFSLNEKFKIKAKNERIFKIMKENETYKGIFL